MNDPHPRLRKIPVEKCQASCPVSEDDFLNVILFKHDFKLRSHAIRHFGNTLEMSAFKNRDRSSSHSEIICCLNELKERDCSFLSNSQDSGRDMCTLDRCPFVEDCPEIIEPLIQGYISIIEKTLEEALVEPRYACFVSTENDQHALWAMPSGNIIMKAALMNDVAYNLMTCYSNSSMSFGEMRKRQVQKLIEEARNKREIVWCNEDNWDQPIQNNSTKRGHKGKGQESGRYGKKTKPAKRKPYTRGGGNTRRYLDDYEDGF